jgi:hypothetical protein
LANADLALGKIREITDLAAKIEGYLSHYPDPSLL